MIVTSQDSCFVDVCYECNCNFSFCYIMGAACD